MGVVMFKGIQAKINFSILIVLVVSFSAFFLIIDKKRSNEIIEEKLREARVVYGQIKVLQNYIGKNRGIWIKNPDDNRNVAKEGNFVRKNTSIVLAELSDALIGNKDYTFRVVSPKPLNSKNISNNFENQAFMKFRTIGENAEVYKFDFEKEILTYVKPMVTEAFCIKCHPDYELGGIEGGISIQIPVTDSIVKLKSNRIYYASFFGITLIILLIIMVTLMNVIVVKPIKKLTENADKISTGELNVSAEMHRSDEIGELSHAIERLRISFKKLMKLK